MQGRRDEELRSDTGAGGREEIMLFDDTGGVVFASPGLSSLVPGPIEHQADLERALHLSADVAISAAESASPGGQPVEGRSDEARQLVRLTVHAIELSAGDGEPVRLVVARDEPRTRDSTALRDAFGRILAHELRTPVTSIYGGAQLLLETSLSAETQHEAAVMVAAEAERLYRVVEDLLILARFDEPLELGDAPVLLQRFLPAVVGAEMGRFPGIRFVADVPETLPAVRGRQGYVEQVLRHLLGSAARFSPPGSSVRVVARHVRNDVEIRVVDHGPAIAPEEARTMFELFARTPRTAGDASGANLGLFVARRLVHAMGGEIRALTTARPTVLVSLPIFPEEE